MKHIVWTDAMVADLRNRAGRGETAAQVAIAYGLSAAEEKRIYTAAARFGIRFSNIGRPVRRRGFRLVLKDQARRVFENAARRRGMKAANLAQALIDCIAAEGETLINNLLDDTP